MNRLAAVQEEVRNGNIPPQRKKMVEEEIAKVLNNPQAVAASFQESASAEDEFVKERAEVLQDLGVERIAEAMRDPIRFMQEALPAFAKKFPGRVTRKFGSNEVLDKFCTTRMAENLYGEVRPVKELEMAVSSRVNELGEEVPVSFTAATDFRNDDPDSTPIQYIFHAGSEASGLTVTRAYKQGEDTRYDEVTDPAECYTLFQAFVTDLHYAEQNYDSRDDLTAKRLQ